MANATSTRPEDLREQMISHIRTVGHLRSERIEQAFRAVPRHRFVPAASVEPAYANKTITINPGVDGPASCISVPTVVAMRLGQLDPQPGDRPAATQLAERLVQQIRRFDRDSAAQPVITAYLAGTADEDLPAGVVIDKHHVRMVVTP